MAAPVDTMALKVAVFTFSTPARRKPLFSQGCLHLCYNQNRAESSIASVPDPNESCKLKWPRGETSIDIHVLALVAAHRGDVLVDVGQRLADQGLGSALRHFARPRFVLLDAILLLCYSSSSGRFWSCGSWCCSTQLQGKSGIRHAAGQKIAETDLQN